MNEEPRATIIPIDQVSAQPVARARGARLGVLLGPATGPTSFITRRFILEPGAYIPAHLHPEIEHQQVMLRGAMVLGLSTGERTVQAGDAVFLPPGCAHSYENRGSEPAEFLCVIPVTSDYETTWLEAPPPGAVPAG